MSISVISLGGSLVVPEAGKVDIAFLRKFRAVILKYVKRGQWFAIIVGGGKLARVWQKSLQGIAPTTPNPSSGPPSGDLPQGDRRGNQKGFLPLSKGEIKRGLRDDLDWIGIRATQLNAELVRAMFDSVAYPELVINPAQKVKTFKILIGAGYAPGHSTDYDSAVRAKTVGAKTVVNLSNVQYVYNKDPRKFKNARPLTQISWKEYFRMFGRKWIPGANVPFDQKAAQLASKSGMKVVFLSGDNLNNLERFLQGKSFRGTVIG